MRCILYMCEAHQIHTIAVVVTVLSSMYMSHDSHTRSCSFCFSLAYRVRFLCAGGAAKMKTMLSLVPLSETPTCAAKKNPSEINDNVTLTTIPKTVHGKSACK